MDILIAQECTKSGTYVFKFRFFGVPAQTTIMVTLEVGVESRKIYNVPTVFTLYIGVGIMLQRFLKITYILERIPLEHIE